jgi:general secretion pathway protein A
MFEEYWKLKEKPFDNNYDLRFLYLSLQHEEAITRLLFAIKDRRHGVVLSGSYGSGKSIILNYLLHRAQEMDETLRFVQITDPLMTMTEFFREFLHQLGEPVDMAAARPLLSATLRKKLMQVHEAGKHAIIAIDEVDLISDETMQEMRLLLDLCHPKTQGTLVTMVFCGCLGDSEHGHFKSRALRQRIPIRCELDSFDADQCAEYIAHRLKVAGQPNQLFTDDAIELIAEASQGAPRAINNICDLCLFLGSSRNLPKVDAEVVEAVAQEIAGSLS